MNLKWKSVHSAARKIYEYHHVTSRQSLADFYNVKVRQPTTPPSPKRDRVASLLLSGLTPPQIAAKMHCTQNAVELQLLLRRRKHNVKCTKDLLPLLPRPRKRTRATRPVPSLLPSPGTPYAGRRVG
jgi:DNA-binding NarL/FixJ family response regulator